jgi:predicted transcriptional regulator
MRRPFPAVTPLGHFMIENGITNERLARHANFSIVTIFKLRRGRSEPHLQTMVAMARAASEIIRRRVRAEELFNLGDDE